MRTHRVTIDGNNIREFLAAEVAMIATLKRTPHANGYLNSSDLILKHGRAWTPRKLPKGLKSGAPKMCFANAQKLSYQKNLIYCEGYAVGVIPVLHGWCVDESGNVIDPTWTGKGQRPEIGTEYFGVAITKGYVVHRLLQTRMHHALTDDYMNDWPLFKAPLETWRHPINDL